MVFVTNSSHCQHNDTISILPIYYFGGKIFVVREQHNKPLITMKKKIFEYSEVIALAIIGNWLYDSLVRAVAWLSHQFG